MPTTTNVTNLTINELTEAQYDSAVQGGTIGANEISILTDVDDKPVQVSTLPTAGADELGNIYQFVGTTDANYTNGYFYKCVSDGGNPATYSWTAVQVQAGGGSSLPSQTGNAGKFLTTDGTDASWGTINALQNEATGLNSANIAPQPNSSGTVTGTYSTAINCKINSNAGGSSFVAIGNTLMSGLGSYIPGSSSVAIGTNSKASGSNALAIGNGTANGNYSTVINALNNDGAGAHSIAIGTNSKAAAASSIQIGHASSPTIGTNSDANTFKVANENGNFELMSADGTIPAARHASLPAADGTYVLKLVISGGVPTLSWVAE